MAKKTAMDLFVCNGANCSQRGNEEIAKEVAFRIASEGLDEQIGIRRRFCFRLCTIGPNMILFPDGEIYSELTIGKLDEILPPLFERARQLKAQQEQANVE